MSSAPSSATGDSSSEALRLIDSLELLDLDRAVIAGEYVRFDEPARNTLKDFRRKVTEGLTSGSPHPSNFLIWGAPGSGKSFLVQQVARSVGGNVKLLEANLAQIDAAELRARLVAAESGSSDVVCLIDEIDARSGESWPFELLLPALEPAGRPTHRIVYCLAGSGGIDLGSLKGLLRARPKGPDLLSRIPQGNEFTVPPLRLGDKLLVTASQILAAAASEGRDVRAIEKFALFYIASNPELTSARQLRALAAEGVRRIPPGDDRFRFDHLFAAGDAENKRFWYEHAAERDRLSELFVPIARPTAAPTSRASREGADPRGPHQPRGIEHPRIAILPFLNISSEPQDTFFSDGLTEELIAQVSHFGTLGVIARTSVMRFRDGAKSVAEAGRELRVGALLEGSVRRAGNELRVTAQLIDVESEEPMWSMTFDRHLENVFAIQEELARRIAQSLHVQLVGTEPGAPAKVPTRNLEAHDLYLHGRQKFFEVTSEGFRDAIVLFERAVVLDPEFALAHCGLAEAHAVRGNRGFAPLHESLDRAESSARIALRLDPNLAEAHAALAPILYNRYDWVGSLRELDQALFLEPNNVQANFWRAVAVAARGHPEEGLGNALRATELDPLNPRRRVILGQQYYWMRRYDEAIEVLRHPSVAEVIDARTLIAYALLAQGKSKEALAQVPLIAGDGLSDPVQTRIDIGAISARAGQPDRAREALAWLTRPPPGLEVAAGAVAWVHAALGEDQAAFEWFVRAHHEGSMLGVPDLVSDPFLDQFRTSPRFPELVQLFGLPGPTTR